MTPTLIFLIGLGLAALGFWTYHRFAKKQRREKLRAMPLSPEQRQHIQSRMPAYAKLPDDLRVKLDGLINQFLDEIKFYGAEGFEMTQEVRTIIAAQACLLIVNKKDRWYNSLSTIHVYPAAFKSRLREQSGALVTEKDQARSGESWGRGPVVLAWDHAAYGAFLDTDGRNVVFHEFAHQLDQQTGAVDGSPLLDKDQSASQWARVFQTAYERLNDEVKAGRPTFLDAYGATAPAEFFAVATEHFFEQPDELRREEPALYEQMAKYFAVDPINWMS